MSTGLLPILADLQDQFLCVSAQTFVNRHQKGHIAHQSAANLLALLRMVHFMSFQQQLAVTAANEETFQSAER